MYNIRKTFTIFALLSLLATTASQSFAVTPSGDDRARDRSEQAKRQTAGCTVFGEACEGFWQRLFDGNKTNGTEKAKNLRQESMREHLGGRNL